MYDAEGGYKVMTMAEVGVVFCFCLIAAVDCLVAVAGLVWAGRLAPMRILDLR